MPDIWLTGMTVIVGRRWRAIVDEHLRANRQSSARLEVLATILVAPPLSPQVEIARRMRIEGPTLTRLLDSLQNEGFIERLPDPKDKRNRLLGLTPAGTAALEEMLAITDRLRERLVAGLSDNTKTVIVTAMEEMLDRLDAGLPARNPRAESEQVPLS
ncbi:MarR family transcriptional regulator [Altericroceibacterium endophyticum]|uniref:MarR family transcriptional regulator n=1 Tax=Altericroceibacterium endophyticum TaxID=1808508 RepID=A0A6I4T7U3_9SPHN|nr:MarR family transcriptional regulator [Altericroceibacterium endophyticum]